MYIVRFNDDTTPILFFKGKTLRIWEVRPLLLSLRSMYSIPIDGFSWNERCALEQGKVVEFDKDIYSFSKGVNFEKFMDELNRTTRKRVIIVHDRGGYNFYKNLSKVLD